MATHLICPDCGGVLGTAEPGVARCTCFKEEPYISNASPTVDIDADERSGDGNEPLKVCVVCGKNVSGHRRYKDSRGYLCVECNRKEIQTEKAGTIKCDECGKRLKEAGLTFFNGKRICKVCLSGHKDAESRKIKLVSKKHFDAYERKNLLILVGILIVLAIFMLVSWIRTH